MAKDVYKGYGDGIMIRDYYYNNSGDDDEEDFCNTCGA